MLRKQMKMNNNLTFILLSSQNVTIAKDLCDKCVGKNLYSEEYLQNIIGDEKHLFYLLDMEGEIVGYHYCILENMEGIKIGLFKSIGIVPTNREKGLSTKMAKFFLDVLTDEFKVNMILAPAWKQGDFIPAEKTLTRIGFQYFADAKKLWYDTEELECPYCKTQKCICDAAIFIKGGYEQ